MTNWSENLKKLSFAELSELTFLKSDDNQVITSIEFYLVRYTGRLEKDKPLLQLLLVLKVVLF